MKCGLCHRELGELLVEEHHLTPKMKKGKDTVHIHKICHRKIHATFDEKSLATYYNTFDRLREHEEIKKFIKWISKKPLDYYDGSDETAERHGKRWK